MEIRIIIILLLLSSIKLFSQIHHSTFSSQSSVSYDYDVKVLQTVGQLSPVGNYISKKISVIQGFQQPFLKFKIEEIMISEGIVAYPNPFNNYLNFNFKNLKPKSLKVNIYDINGRYVKSINVDRIDGDFKLNLENLISAEYIIRLIGPNINHSIKVIKK